jgi:GT2 family glycosyltransferase/glycosyltransferase involved in cell wall biosynthesis
MTRPKSRIWKSLFSLTKPLQKLMILGNRHLRLLDQTFFSDGFYHDIYPEVVRSGFLPALDYVLFGATERRDPHPLFSTVFYLNQCPAVARQGVNPLLHYIRNGGAERRDPHPLFSTSYYLERRPDVCQAGVNPLIHYLRFGATEHQDPHPLFSGSYYLQKYPDIRLARTIPLLHYLHFGQYERRQPHPLFDPEFYYSTQIDVLRANPGGLTHYLLHGSGEGRAPSAEFDPVYYHLVHPDVAKAGIEPLTHYARDGQSERRSIREPRFESGKAENYLPAIARNHEQPDERPGCVDVIIPVYRGLQETSECLESLFASRNAISSNVVVVNDCTPEIRLRDYLRDLAADHRIELIEHSVNRGFVASTNEGMSLHPERDVVLLNSDTQIFSDWLDRLASHAYSGRVGSVTPFSNNATICSYPKFGENNSIPQDTTAQELDQIMRTVNAGCHCAVPTGVGFCMYIRRDCLDEVGLFDQGTFGIGYGEENDFCMRALERGWTHLLAADVFVYHAGSVSFGSANEIQRRAMEKLLEKHPRYLNYVGRHCRTNPANAFRVAATVYRLQRSGFPVWMSVLHGLGGGALEHVRRLEDLTKEHLLWVRLSAAHENQLTLCCERPGFEFSVTLHVQHEYGLFLRLLREISVARIHVHHVLGLPIDVKALASALGVPYDVTLHDYYFVCPRITFTDDYGRYCGEPGSEECESCVATISREGEKLDLLSWRARNGTLLSGAARVIAPSEDTAKRFGRYFPWLRITPAWHESVSAPIAIPELSENEPLRVAILGVMTLHKGYLNLKACSELAQRTAAQVEFCLIGSVDPKFESEQVSFRSTGSYQPDELRSLIAERSPHVVWFPCQIPETFSYTLSTCFALGLPVAVPDLGAFAERVAGREWSWVLPWDTKPEEWLEFFLRIREQHFRTMQPPPISSAVSAVESEYYPKSFVTPGKAIKTPSRLQDKKKLVLALTSSFANGQIQACGYIRIVQPLTHRAIGSQINLQLLDFDSALHSTPDAVIVQRTAVADEERAERLIDHCRKSKTRLIYEIDDDLFRVPSNHPEAFAYSHSVKAAKLISCAADAITVSTEPLRQELLRYNDQVLVVKNWIDERLWLHAKTLRAHDSSTGIRALYMGTISHKADLEMLEKPVRRLKQEFAFELDVIGVASHPGPSPWFRCIPVPDGACGSYRSFAKWLQTAGTWDFGVAPLLESRFNLSKSPIKIYEYAFIGLPAVVSNVQAYSDTVRHGETGLVARNTEEEWYDSLRLLCEHTALRKRLWSGTLHVRSRWTLSANAAQIRQMWEAALFDTAHVDQSGSLGCRIAPKGYTECPPLELRT